MKLALSLLLAAAVATDAQMVDFVQITGSPYHNAQSRLSDQGVCEDAHACSASALNPFAVMLEPVPTQADTFISLIFKQYLGVRIPIYQFRQSPRLVENQLPFKLVLLRHMDTDGVIEVPTNPAAAADSWFPTHSWTPIMCLQCRDFVHLGWKFYPKAGGEPFYALIVDHGSGNRVQSRSGIFVTPVQGVEACGDEICSMNASKGTGWKGTTYILDNTQPVIRQSLGHCTWTFLHSVASYLPNVGNNGPLAPEVKTSFVNLILSLRHVYACELCRKHFDTLFRQNSGLEARLKEVRTREDAVVYVTALHNAVTLNHVDPSGETLFLPNIRQWVDHSKPHPPAQAGEIGKQWWARFWTRFVSGQNQDKTYRMQRTQLINMADERWNWVAHNLRKRAEEEHEDMFDVQLENQVKQNQKLPPISYETGCAREIAHHNALPPMQQTSHCSALIPPTANGNSNGNGVGDGKGRLRIVLYIMAKCPWCALLMSKMNSILVGMGDRFDVSVMPLLDKVPPQYLKRNPGWHGFTSMHGVMEARSDAWEMCAAKHYPHQRPGRKIAQWLEFLECMDADFGGESTAQAKACCKEAGMSFEKIHMCANSGSEGLTMLAAAIKETSRLHIDSAPTYDIGGRRHDGVKSSQQMLRIMCPML
eukprot:g2448.t1